MPQISSQPDEQIFEIKGNETVLHASLNSGIPHTHACGGRARCSTCRILVTKGIEYCSPRNSLEEGLAQKLGFPQHIRLACQTKVRSDISIRRLVLDIEDEKLANDQIKFGKIGEEKSLAILFCDIRGFTKLSELMLPYDVIYILNRYFQAMGEVVDKYNGVINNYMGDGFMALFGINNSEQAAENAVRASLKMLEVLEILNNSIELLFAHPLKIGIGIHYGTVVLGSVGTRTKKNITAIGDVVNFASRIESANKEFGTSLLVSAEVYNILHEQVTISGGARSVEIRGKTGTYNLYEVLSIEDEYSNFELLKSDRQNKSSYLKSVWQLLQTKIFFNKYTPCRVIDSPTPSRSKI